jgi:hypothetical protein
MLTSCSISSAQRWSVKQAANRSTKSPDPWLPQERVGGQTLPDVHNARKTVRR